MTTSGVSLSRLKQFKDIELSYDSAAALTVKFYTDMPGSVMALRKTLTFPLTSGRQTKTLPLDDTGGAPVEGTLFQVEITSTGVVRLFGGLVRVRGIGVWFDGGATPAERWITQPMGIGV